MSSFNNQIQNREIKVKVLIFSSDLLLAKQLEDVMKPNDSLDLMVYTDVDSLGLHIEAMKPDIIIMITQTENDFRYLVSNFLGNKIPIIAIVNELDEALCSQMLKVKPKVIFLTWPVHSLTLNSMVHLLLSINSTNNLSEDIKANFFISNRRWRKKLSCEEILWIEADGNYCFIHTATEKFSLKKSMALVYKMLPQHQFIQIHRAYIVQTKCIEKVSFLENRLWLAQQELPVGSKYKTIINQKIRLLG
ncbi:MAG: LytTR family DNA-binding domain-containing protein [Spirosomataceae bacterium]